MDASKKFASKDAEIDYWKNLSEQFQQELKETKDELEEFQISSHELEQELETQLKQEEKKNKELSLANERLQSEVDSLKEKLQKLQADSYKKLTELEDNYARVEAHKNELQKYIRELEQDNDDLERAKRATIVSLEDFEQRLNQAIERNAFLESELDEKGALLETVQRLKDEARDLKSEIDIRKHQDVGVKDGDACLGVAALPMQDSGYAAQGTSPTTPTTPMGRVPGAPGISNGISGTPLTSSARISALNIVGDLLRKVGFSGRFQRNSMEIRPDTHHLPPKQDSLALESKLANCRNFTKDEPRSKTGTSPLNSPRSELVMVGSGIRTKRCLTLNA
ncbi:nuclear distribution protein nudE-like 1-A isoform X2 [Biomphalaria glabrata]|uniref:Nuclear distribution protein nudE-like 1-A isoform X2 n=1 Tax=Biomphalaria glabrata TaxID=6526 RepID=A0A9W2ZIU5_BIOGL|nr:nuclear distribution protein nudE-like 1-A isoform X2 [Biomphalaria glabrata]